MTADHIPSHRLEKGPLELIPLFTGAQLDLGYTHCRPWMGALCVPTGHTVSFLCHGDMEETVLEAEARVARKGTLPS